MILKERGRVSAGGRIHAKWTVFCLAQFPSTRFQRILERKDWK